MPKKSKYKVPQLFNADEPVYLVGGGASLSDFDFKRLAGKRVIAINTAYRKCTQADVLFFGDVKFYNQHRDLNGQDFWRFKGAHIITTAKELKGKLPQHIQWLESKEADFSTSPSYMAAPAGLMRNSGWQAINLAYLAGARRIVLLGFDCSLMDGKTHWHSDTALQHLIRPTKKAVEQQAAEFEALGAHIAEAGIEIEIINASPRSAITCWPRVTIEEALQYAMPA